MSRDCSGLVVLSIVCIVVACCCIACNLSTELEVVESSTLHRYCTVYSYQMYKKLMTHDCTCVICRQREGMLIASDRYNIATKHAGCICSIGLSRCGLSASAMGGVVALDNHVPCLDRILQRYFYLFSIFSGVEIFLHALWLALICPPCGNSPVVW